MTALPEIADFLAAHPPFNALDRAEVERAAADVEVEFHTAGTLIFTQGTESNPYLRVVRTGEVEIVHDGRVLDQVGPGEMFGHASMLSGLPTGFAARAAEDTLVYRIPREVAQDVLGSPEGLRYVVRALLSDPYGVRSLPVVDPRQDQLRQPVGTILRGEPVVCSADEPIRDVAARMVAAGVSSAVVKLPGLLGILTDRDLRARVVAAGRSLDAPVSDAMTSPAFTVPAERPAGDVLMEMLDRGIHHVPIVGATGGVLGVVEVADLVSVETRSWFALRQTIARAPTQSDVVEAGRELRPMVVAMHGANGPALEIMAVFSTLADALTRRLIELSVEETSAPLPPASMSA